MYNKKHLSEIQAQTLTMMMIIMTNNEAHDWNDPELRILEMIILVFFSLSLSLYSPWSSIQFFMMMEKDSSTWSFSIFLSYCSLFLSSTIVVFISNDYHEDDYDKIFIALMIIIRMRLFLTMSTCFFFIFVVRLIFLWLFSLSI